VRVLRHSNINSLIGACLEPSKVCIVVNYCAKGSLRDVLQSRHITMDKIFTTAFASDIVQVCLKIVCYF
jgi:guanylate cyclase